MIAARSSTFREIVRRSAMRLGFCSLAYLAVAWGWLAIADDPRFLQSFNFWFVVIFLPVAGLLTDLIRAALGQLNHGAAGSRE